MSACLLVSLSRNIAGDDGKSRDTCSALLRCASLVIGVIEEGRDKGERNYLTAWKLACPSVGHLDPAFIGYHGRWCDLSRNEATYDTLHR